MKRRAQVFELAALPLRCGVGSVQTSTSQNERDILGFLEQWPVEVRVADHESLSFVF
jgi:hypothetical protein